MHWRGDRANGFFGIDPFDSNLSFNNCVFLTKPISIPG